MSKSVRQRLRARLPKWVYELLELGYSLLAYRRLAQAARDVLRHPTVASKRFLVTIGDRTVGGLNHRDQMVGPWQVPVADCAVTLADFQGFAGEAMSMAWLLGAFDNSSEAAQNDDMRLTSGLMVAERTLETCTLDREDFDLFEVSALGCRRYIRLRAS